MEFQRNPYGIVPWNPPGIVPWNPSGLSMESSGIHMEWCWIPYGIDHSMIIPHGIHDVYGIRNWLGPLPTSIPWIPYGLYWGR